MYFVMLVSIVAMVLHGGFASADGAETTPKLTCDDCTRILVDKLDGNDKLNATQIKASATKNFPSHPLFPMLQHIS